MKSRQTRTAYYMRRLRRVSVGHVLRLANGDGHYNQLALWRHAAKKLGQSISIKTAPNGVRLYRIR